MSRSPSRTWLVVYVGILVSVVALPSVSCAQGHDHHGAPPAKTPATTAQPGMNEDAHMVGMADHVMNTRADSIMMLHMELTPARAATHDDSARALAVVAELRDAIAKYKDVSVAERDGYRMFAPNIKHQRVYHFTSRRNAFKEAFRFDAEQPTSLLYKRAPDGQFVLIGAMYTLPKRAGLDKLNDRVPLSIARWHKHVNWCVPPLRDKERWLEMKNGRRVFGPESPIATKEACDAVGGNFFASPLGWMLHANVFAGDDLAEIFGDHHQ